MLMLTSTAQPDYVALGMVLVLAVVVAVMALRKRSAIKNAPAMTEIPVQPEEKPEPAKAPGAAGQVKIHDVPPQGGRHADGHCG